MKAVLITLIATVTLGIIVWIRGGEDFHIARSLPFLGGEKPGFYDFAGLILLLVMLWGIGRLGHPSKDSPNDEAVTDYEIIDERDDTEPRIEDDEDE